MFSAKDTSKLKSVKIAKGIIFQLVSPEDILAESSRVSFVAFQGRCTKTMASSLLYTISISCSEAIHQGLYRTSFGHLAKELTSKARLSNPLCLLPSND